MTIATHEAQQRFSAALEALAGSSQREVAELANMHEVTLSRMLNGTRVLNGNKLKTDICRKGLMVKAALLGYGEDEILKYTEHRIFGLPEADPQLLLADARRLASQRREEMYGVAK